MNQRQLFRQEVLEQKKYQNYGTVFIHLPSQYKILTVVCGIFLVSGCFFIYIVPFTEKTIVKGFINSTKGLVRIYPRKEGVITKIFVKQGDLVQKGDALLLIETSLEGRAIQAKILEQFKIRRKTLEKAITYKKMKLQRLNILLAKKYIAQEAYHHEEEGLTQLEMDRMRMEAEFIEYKKEKTYQIRAPISGIIANMQSSLGQYTHGDKPLIKILPENAKFHAEILIPVRHMGAIKTKDRVVIHYDAFPHARFGSAFATIVEISQSPLISEEEDIFLKSGEPYYKVIADLDAQEISYYGARKSVQQGMTFSATLLGTTRTLAQWIFDPVISFKGRMFT